MTWARWSIRVAGAVYALQAVLCFVVWWQWHRETDAGAVRNLAPFPGGYSSMRLLWAIGLLAGGTAIAGFATAKAARSLGLTIIAAVLGLVGLLITHARPGINAPRAHSGTMFLVAGVLYVVALGCAFVAAVLSHAESEASDSR